MKIFLFVIDGRPTFRTTLIGAQAALEDRLWGREGVSDVWWDDARPYEARVYLYGSSHSDYGADPEDPYKDVSFETTEQLIWPVEVGADHSPAERLDPLVPGGVELSMEVRTDEGSWKIIRRETSDFWSEKHLRPHLITHFAVHAGHELADRWTDKEST